eukprot:Gregarina_sp_Pseudo_9__1971@NODE_2363_length_1025_cov_14_811359_g2176_i0_p1_GENE_NODE_2363_length_1025_cov_14_811359_g2176_i0NODE_2363_length_1025_cov_14_811359_g2176_i0_p1_ORF_typecomplete_len308_score19_42DSPc/PF00782_20/1e07Y_phosphatase3/PF13350_6/0_00025Y_phosphatase2/PF03162_13/0_00051Y_phosphatase/PF00102_27/0_0027PTPlike_phytase/PF14566_6/5_5e03PTPlike_phytase/PF14566_6/0_054CDKN3/PF05706_12/0_12_NODE_2363_length_1025_cov_14_811359_g2176_i053976
MSYYRSEPSTNPLLDVRDIGMGKPRRLPGGPFPEGWEFFKPASQACWLVRSSRPGSYTVLGICPCKTPLDARFDSRRRQIREAQAKARAMFKNPNSEEERTVLERLRQSADRFCGSWHPVDIPWCLGDSWLPAGGTPANVKAIVNLCATERYYSPTDFLDANVEYIWHKMEGGGHIPSAKDLSSLSQLLTDLSTRFSVEVSASSLKELRLNVLKEMARLPVVLMHCTHGVNRTGFSTAAMALLHDRELKVEQALRLFGQIRGHRINRPELEAALYELFEPQSDENSENSFSPQRSDGVVVYGLDAQE